MTLSVSGQPMEEPMVARALQRLSEQRPIVHGLRCSGDHAEIQFWEEGESLLDVASLALRVWMEHRSSAGLPRWELVGLEIVERDLHASRAPEATGADVVQLHEVRPTSF
ncbi:hypothetical protein [Nocardioides massiliensis]|uniref:Uncharacterized protein n=1 Tax=Nocardioides massiliensis TaxID=1325935 RepID=A0ABT9NPM0_9ACTN|nr:hypothetical protein [Nocardioides massiliensis]MDP9822379.1 hypothetical protein [Nocardioides massiliensis]